MKASRAAAHNLRTMAEIAAKVDVLMDREPAADAAPDLAAKVDAAIARIEAGLVQNEAMLAKLDEALARIAPATEAAKPKGK